jgi:hypothetical protein
MQQTTKELLSVVDLYHQVIQYELGLFAVVDADGDVLFKHPALGSLYVKTFTDDPEFLMLVFPNFTNRERLGVSAEDLFRALNNINGKTKAAKLFVHESSVNDGTYNVTASIECFLADTDQAPDTKLIKAVIRRSFSVMRHSASTLLNYFSAQFSASEEQLAPITTASVH